MLLQGRFEHLDLWIKFIEVSSASWVWPSTVKDALALADSVWLCRSNMVKLYLEIHGIW
jgi:hypothetical protein